MATGEPEDWKTRFEGAVDGAIDLRAQVARLEAAKVALAAALNEPVPNVPGCDCDRDGDADSPLCEMHKKRFAPLQWETLAFMVVDLEAYVVAARAVLSPDAGKGSRVPYGQETRAVWGKDGKPCHDCAVRVGGLHQPGCDVEECPVCHLQLITCACDDATLDALKGKVENWEPWMAALGRFMFEQKILRFPDDVLAWKAERDAAIERAEAAEALAERRLNRGLAALDILRAVLEVGHTTVTVGDHEWKGWGTARVLTPAEAQADQTDQADPTDPNP